MYLDDTTVNAGDKEKFLQKSFMDAIIEQIQDQTPPKDPTEKKKIKKLIEENKSLWEKTTIKELFETYFQMNDKKLNENISKIVEMFIEEINYRQNNPKTKKEEAARVAKEGEKQRLEAAKERETGRGVFISMIGP